MLAALIGSVVGALWLVMEWIYCRAKRARVSPMPAYVIALVGYMIGTAGMVLAASTLLEMLYEDNAENDFLTFGVLVVCSSLGASMGATAGYVYIWVRTVDDPDYGPLEKTDVE